MTGPAPAELTDEQRLVKLVADVIAMHSCNRGDGHAAYECVTARAVIENLRRKSALRLLASVGLSQGTGDPEK